MRSLVCAVLLAACSSSPKQPTSPAPTPTPAAAQPGAPAIPMKAPVEKLVAADTPWADTDGNTFIVPAEWKVSTFDTMTVLNAPEGDTHIAFVDVSAASS